ncbi:hypothetical protein LEN26_021338 [Aphanomyces euteiches]|nr:hypothetical protein LEN26_021338 [Aphanomyces euteiches]KAH9103253.1 hypothetical protein AeMF1_020391 [Aphanomyces euteiches]KAH9192280.1 hypothetical protein AeNC1_005739 [Aphanomyces euteiches]
MLVPFTKFNGAGNDFVLIDNRTLGLKITPEQAIRICHRQRGVGADGLLLLVDCTSGRADFAWQFIQCDGDTANMCGNGARCFVRFVHSLLGHTNPIKFETGAGVVSAFSNGEVVSIQLPDPKHLILNESINLASGQHTVHSVDTGVPHAVLFTKRVDNIDILAEGSEVRHHSHFAPRGTNVNFVQIIKLNHLRVRSFERGVEGETMACGTGVAAAALVASKIHGFTSPVTIQVESGATLTITFDGFSNVWLAGPAKATFTGVIEL